MSNAAVVYNKMSDSEPSFPEISPLLLSERETIESLKLF